MQMDNETPEKTVKEKQYGFLTFYFFFYLKLLKKKLCVRAHSTFSLINYPPHRNFNTALI